MNVYSVDKNINGVVDSYSSVEKGSVKNKRHIAYNPAKVSQLLGIGLGLAGIAVFVAVFVVKFF